LTTRMKNRTALVSNIKTFIFQSLLFDSMWFGIGQWQKNFTFEEDIV
jgi:hypothetical protein